MKVLLINPPSYFKQYQYKRTPDVLPLGVLYVAKALLDAGHKVKFLDIFAEDLPLDTVIRRLQECQNERFDMVGITAMSVQYAYVKWLSKQIKVIFGNIPIVVGGALAIFSHDVLLNNTHVDITVTGEGEKTILDLASNMPLKNIRGIAYKKNGKITVNPPADLVKNLDSIGYPAYELLPMGIYRKNMQFEMEIQDKNGKLKKEKFYYFCISGGRGCPFNCNFCSRCFPGLRLRSVDNIIEEIKFFQRHYSFNSVMFFDELALIGKKRILELAEKMKPLHLYWTANSRAEYLNKEILKKLKDSGCYQISFGIESGSQRILDAMNKKQKIEVAQKTLKAVIDAGLKPNVQMIFGYPGENEESLRETYKFFKDIPVNVGFAILTPLPGSKLYDDCIKRGFIPNEDKYLTALETGFSTLHLNLTDWTNNEFLRKREQLAININDNTIKLKYGILKWSFYKFGSMFKQKISSLLTTAIKKIFYKLYKLFSKASVVKK